MSWRVASWLSEASTSTSLHDNAGSLLASQTSAATFFLFLATRAEKDAMHVIGHTHTHRYIVLPYIIQIHRFIYIIYIYIYTVNAPYMYIYIYTHMWCNISEYCMMMIIIRVYILDALCLALVAELCRTRTTFNQHPLLPWHTVEVELCLLQAREIHRPCLSPGRCEPMAIKLDKPW